MNIPIPVLSTEWISVDAFLALYFFAGLLAVITLHLVMRYEKREGAWPLIIFSTFGTFIFWPVILPFIGWFSSEMLKEERNKTKVLKKRRKK